MRMDRYDEMDKNESRQTRTNKNQELYSDVYLNNSYVDIDSLKDVVSSDIEQEKEVEEIKRYQSNQNMESNYKYVEKNYDINLAIEEAIKNKKDDKLKRSLDIEVNNLEIDSLIESINENQKNKKNKNLDNESLLSELLPSNDDTKVIPALEEPILDTKLIDKNMLSKDGNDTLKDLSMQDLESDASFVEEKKSKLKIILLIVLILIVILGICYVLNQKGII